MIPTNLTGKALFDFIVTNKHLLIAAKKAEIKRADSVLYSPRTFEHDSVSKEISEDATKLKAEIIANTTFWYDSHGDVHIDGLWKKTLQDNPSIYLIKEHKMQFENVIAGEEDTKATTTKVLWKDLGINFEGYTQALTLNATLKVERHPYMFAQYKKGYVRNHSVGMRYFDGAYAINHEEYKEEYAVWKKYIDKIANREEVERAGYFYAVTQAGLVEVSAVVKGSNSITPTRNVSEFKAEGTGFEPLNNTQDQPPRIDAGKLASIISNIKF